MATRREAVKVRRGDRDMLFIMASQIISTTHWYDPLSQYFSICKFIYIICYYEGIICRHIPFFIYIYVL